MKYSFLILTLLLGQTVKASFTSDTLYSSESLKIIQIAEQSYLHVSYLMVPRYGKVQCNGLVVSDQNQALVIDTPASIEASNELIAWISTQINKDIIGAVATHFHEDCLGGLKAFHNNGLSSFSGIRTQDLAKTKNLEVPQISFEHQLNIQLGNEQLILDYAGEGHTLDNIIAYYAKDQIMFGGCLIKSVGSGKGNIDDANIDSWPQTVKTLQDKYLDVKIVVPGHGKPGGPELLHYTQDLFNKSK